jgi:predicted nucleic acid-binding protein
MPEMTVVNTSPLFYLHRLGLLEVLNRLYGNVTIPKAVKEALSLLSNLPSKSFLASTFV